MVCSETTKTVLEAGTWTESTTAPDIFTEDEEVKGLNNYIMLVEDNEEIIRSSDGVRLYALESCTLKLYSSTTTKRNDYITDMESIFVASSEALRLRSGTPYARIGRYTRDYIVELTTKS